jgi:hypothetical protein
MARPEAVKAMDEEDMKSRSSAACPETSTG